MLSHRQELFVLVALFVVTQLCVPAAREYKLVEDYSPQTFFDHFDFYDGDDPTNGYGKYRAQR